MMQYLSKRFRKRYKCSNCGRRGIKLWRQYQTFANEIELLCLRCAVHDQCKEGEKYLIRSHPSQMIMKEDCSWSYWGDQIGWLVPAVPTQDGRTYWGYTSVPKIGCEWWHSLKLKIKPDVRKK